MQMTLRWYGSKYDTVTLKQIRQIPDVTSVRTQHMLAGYLRGGSSEDATDADGRELILSWFSTGRILNGRKRTVLTSAP